ncbi:MAG: N-acetylmuramoyl-L-alanine amidase [Bacteroidales bacterium]|nr:N-acetylmuramoyl-L-alanine amidase [Bacteroidales bacterium]
MKNLGTICLALLLSFSLLPAKAEESVGLRLETVVLDPGHGGKDAGAVSKDKKTYEKNLVLSIAKATEEKIKAACPDVKVVLTRRKDVFLPLLERAEIANRNKANLFISIHINASTKTSPNGFSAHILGESRNPGNDVFGLNMNVSKRENSVVMLEEDYSVKYKGFDPSDPASAIVFNLIQSAYYEQSLYFACCMDGAIAPTSLARRGVSQDNFYVLWRTSMPAVLLECGFISNAKDLAYLKTKEGIDQVAEAICNGFLAFKKNYETTVATSAPEPVVPAAEYAAETYGIQVLVSARSDRKIEGYPDAQPIKDGRFYKYIVGRSASLEPVKKMSVEVKKKYPDSFIVLIDEKGVSPCKK